MLASDDASIESSQGCIMHTTVTLDDDLLAQGELLCEDLERSALLKEALRALVQRESAKRLAALGGSEPELKPIPRRRSAA
jgi:Arc/MetJ family transcription regulator